MPGIPRPAPSQPAPFGGRAYFICAIVGIVTLIGALSLAYDESRAATLGYVVPSGLAEHTTLCYPRQPVTEAPTPTNTELWLYWLTDQNADYCNFTIAQSEEQKGREESLKGEVKTLSTTVSAMKTELESVKVELGNVKKVDESIVTTITGLGSESKPLFVKTPPAEPTSKVEVADFTSGAQTDLGEFQQHVETVGYFIIGTILAAMVTIFAFMLLRPKR